MKKLWRKLNKEYLPQIGMERFDFSPSEIPEEVSAYADQENERPEAHMNFLKNLLDNENRRLELIESKSTQLIGQTGVIFSLLSLFVPLLADKMEGIALGFKIGLLLLLLCSFVFYLLTIRNALKNYNIRHYNYMDPGPENVRVLHDAPLPLFYSEVIRDMLKSVYRNKELNNWKGRHLIQSSNCFRIANTNTSFLVISFCLLLLFAPKAKPDKPFISSLHVMVQPKQPANVARDTAKKVKTVKK